MFCAHAQLTTTVCTGVRHLRTVRGRGRNGTSFIVASTFHFTPTYPWERASRLSCLSNVLYCLKCVARRVRTVRMQLLETRQNALRYKGNIVRKCSAL